jgi:hypothetical protein
MKKFSMKCSCGDVMTVDAKNREEAVTKLKAMMTADTIATHMKEKHPSDPLISVADCHAQIERDLQEV